MQVDEDAPTIVATTGIWADVVSNVACGGLANVEALIPVGGDPHGYEPSLQDRGRMEDAALVVANGLALEERLLDTLESVAEAGTPVFEVAEAVDTIPYSFGSGHDDHEGHDHDEHSDEESHDEHDDHEGHDHDEHSDEEDHDEHDDHEGHDHHGHDHSGGDPHVWFDPHRVAEALPDLVRVLNTEAGIDAAELQACADIYQAELEAVDAEIAASVAQLPAENRKLVTNHDALGYYADRYEVEVIGAVIPSPSSMAQTNPAQLEELAELIEHEGIQAIFAETQHTSDDAESLAARVGDIEVVTLYTGSLGPPGSGAETYLGFLRTNTELIVGALS
ncbi:MAG: metal ABC transporter substrate-binding protein [Acidimicrobiaceae bacterium]|nr:metal ABC transporter substrate-binding protein [Acidimicrobiaceae bacterium]